jgi:hypothetical protein
LTTAITELGHRTAQVEELHELVFSHPGLVEDGLDGLAEAVEGASSSLQVALA